jgi:TfoX/Sxy family transcriptional regulator of competence genes
MMTGDMASVFPLRPLLGWRTWRPAGSYADLRLPGQASPMKETAMADDVLAARVRAILTGTGITEKKMFGGVCFLVNGHMTVAASERGLLVRVGKANHAAALARPDTRPMERNGRGLAGYIYVSGDGTKTDAGLRYWLGLARKEVESLPARTAAAPRAAARRRSARPPRSAGH